MDNLSPIKASVIIPIFNGLSTLPLQIDALEQQVDAPSFEIIISDNGSTDGLKEWVLNRSKVNSFIRYCDASQCRGAGYARNVGVARAQGDYLLFCDADDLVSRTWVEAAVRGLELYPVLTGAAQTIFEQEFSAIDTTETGWRLMLPRKNEDVYKSVKKGSLAPALLGGNFAIRREIFELLNGFDIHFSSGSEDNDLSYRISQQGITLMESSNMRILYRIRKNYLALLKRGYETGFTFSELTAKHDAWDFAVPYQSLNLFSVPKSLIKFLIGLRPGDVEGNIMRFSTFLTILGLLVGKYNYKTLQRPLSFQEGVGLDTK